MKRVRRIIRNIIAFFFISTILSVLLYRFVPVYITPLMLIRYAQGIMAGEEPRFIPSMGFFRGYEQNGCLKR